MDNHKVSKQFFDEIYALIEECSGIKITGVHETYIRRSLYMYLLKYDLTEISYLKCLKTSPQELKKLINLATINETYFFREEKQFELLQQVIFPKLLTQNRSIKIWSAACSSGEEAISLAALAIDANLQFEIWATDINESKLENLKSGEYFINSFRADGSKFNYLLLNKDCKLVPPEKYKPDGTILNKINVMNYNLASTENLPTELCNADIIFLRNVFIYFDENTRTKIVTKICNSMNNGSLLFLSTSEIASLNTESYCPQLHKIKTNNVYYFIKQEKNTNQISKNEQDCPLIKYNTHIKNKNLIDSNITYSSIFDEQVFIDLIKKVKKELACNNKIEACRIVDEFPTCVNKQDIISFIKGYVFIECQYFEKAEKEFIKAEVINPSLWPAFFLHAQLLEQRKNLKKCYNLYDLCADILEKYLKNKQTNYDYLLDSFNSVYFYKICCKYREGDCNVYR